MTKKDEIVKYKHENGYLFTKDTFENDISNSVLCDSVKHNGIERVAHGIYIVDDTIPDLYYILSIKNQRIVFSLESALYLNNLMEREPEIMTVTIPRGYNASHIRNNGIRVFTRNKDIFELGITYVKTNLGNVVRTYDIERTICDVIKNKEKMDIQVFTYALKEYVKRNDKDLVKLITYSQILKIEDEVRKYIEVLI